MRGALLTALREATADAHVALEKVTPLSRPVLRPEEYREHLMALAGFQVPLEAALFAAHEWAELGLPEARERIRAPALRADLEALGVPANTLPTSADLPEVRDVGAALGALYVLEGSTLGGQVLTRRIREALGGAAPVAFLFGSGDTTGARWQSFTEFAERLAASNPNVFFRAIQGAKETFDKMQSWFQIRTQDSSRGVRP